MVPPGHGSSHGDNPMRAHIALTNPENFPCETKNYLEYHRIKVSTEKAPKSKLAQQDLNGTHFLNKLQKLPKFDPLVI